MGLPIAVLALGPLIGLAVCVVVHVLVSRAAPALPRLHGIAVSVGAGLVVASVLPWLADSGAPTDIGGWGAALAWLSTYLLLAYCYVIGFFNLGESARRIRLLIELEQAGPRGLSLEEILTVYNARMIVTLRTERLMTGGQIVERDGRYVLRSPVMLRAAKALTLLKVVLLGARSEFGGG